MARRSRGKVNYPKVPVAVGRVSGPSICTSCMEPVDLTAFRDARIAGRYPIVHTCGRVLMREPR